MRWRQENGYLQSGDGRLGSPKPIPDESVYGNPPKGIPIVRDAAAEAEALCLEGWRNFESMLRATHPSEEADRALAEGRVDALPFKLRQLWDYLQTQTAHLAVADRAVKRRDEIVRAAAEQASRPR